MEGLVYDTAAQLFANDTQLNAVVELDMTGAIIAQTPANMPLATPDGLTYDHKTDSLYATSNTGQVIYKISTRLDTVSTIAFTVAPVLEGITSDGSGSLYVVGVNGSSSTIYKYAVFSSTQTKLNTIPGLDDIALIPPGPYIKNNGTTSACEDRPDDSGNPPSTSPN